MIHNSSVIDKKAKVSKTVKIGPFCYVGPEVELSDGVELVSNVHIEGNTKIGKGTKIFPFASIGTQPQDLLPLHYHHLFLHYFLFLNVQKFLLDRL